MSRSFYSSLFPFTQGRKNFPYKNSFFASYGLNPFLEVGKMLPRFFLKNEEKSSVLTNLKNADLIKVSSDGYGFNSDDGKIFKSSSLGGTWTEYRTNANGAHTGKPLLAPDSVTPSQNNLYYTNSTTIGRAVSPYATGDFTDSWKTGLESGVPHEMAIVKDWVLVTNGRYIGGWKFSTGIAEVFSTNLLDFSPGYTTKKIIQKKAAGVRLAYIMATHIDREKDGIGIWDLNSTEPALVDFIPIPYLQDFFFDKGRLYVIHGNQCQISLHNGEDLLEQGSIIEKLISGSVNVTAEFLGRWGPLILIAANGQRDSSLNGAGFYPGLWAFHPAYKALFYWLPISTGDKANVTINSIIASSQNDLWVSSKSSDYSGSNPRYYLDKLRTIEAESGTYFTMMTLPELGRNFPDIKIWQKFKFNHNVNGTNSGEIEIKKRDYSKPFILASPFTPSAVTSTSFTKTGLDTSLIKAGDEVTVIGGTGSGQIRHITGISGDVYTIDRAWDTNPTTSSDLEIASFKSLGIFNKYAKDIDFQDKDDNSESVLCQYKIYAKFSGSGSGNEGVEVSNFDISGVTKD